MAASWDSLAAGTVMNRLALRRYGDGDDAGEHVAVWYTNRQASAAALELPNSVPKKRTSDILSNTV